VRTHTGALAGADAAFDAFCAQAGVARCESLATLCETLKIFHTAVRCAGAACSPWAPRAATWRYRRRRAPPGLDFAPIPAAAAASLREILSDRVYISKPVRFSYPCVVRPPRQHAMFSVVQRAGFDVVGFLVDCPPEGVADDSPTSA